MTVQGLEGSFSHIALFTQKKKKSENILVLLPNAYLFNLLQVWSNRCLLLSIFNKQLEGKWRRASCGAGLEPHSSGARGLKGDVTFQCCSYVLWIRGYGCAVLLNNKQVGEAVGEQTPRFHPHWGSCVNQRCWPAGGPFWTLKTDAFQIKTMPCYSIQFFIDSLLLYLHLPLCLPLFEPYLAGGRTVCARWSSAFLSPAGGVSWLLCHHYKSWQMCLGSGVPELPGSIRLTQPQRSALGIPTPGVQHRHQEHLSSVGFRCPRPRTAAAFP